VVQISTALMTEAEIGSTFVCMTVVGSSYLRNGLNFQPHWLVTGREITQYHSLMGLNKKMH